MKKLSLILKTKNTIFYMSFFFNCLGILLSIAFFTLMERKMMGIMHYRKGPNKISIHGILQPISDALKLLTKESTKIKPTKMFLFFLGPFLGMTLLLLCWMWYESMFNLITNKMKIFSIISIMSLSAFSFMLMSWGSNSKYSILGGLRAISQIISYEVCLMIFIFVVIYSSKTYSTKEISMMQQNFWICFFSMPFFFTWMMMCMAESNRTPFDLAEGESEIVSGFNIEYSGGLFALIFITEYGMIMFMSFITSLMFLGGVMMFSMILKIFTVCFLFVWIRCCFPRIRYDKLMEMCWKISLPYSLSLLSFILIIFFL